MVGKGLLIFDGDCAFCARTAAWLRRHLPAEYRIEASQDLPDLQELGLDRKEVHEAAYWIEPDGTRHRAHLAIVRALELSGGLLGFIAKLGSVRPFDRIAAGVYDFVARNRHRLPGGTDRCAD
jgi:predicted DCC family thiol-disulfide oxidoreductase YuxK